MGPKQISESARALAQLSATETPLALMTRPPDNLMEREMIGGQMWTSILMRFEAGLSERDKAFWHNPPEQVSESTEHLRLIHAFDDFLLGHFAEWGWQLPMSVGAIQRISEWQNHNPALLVRLGKELGLRSKVLRGEKSAPLPEDIDMFADSVIPELARLLRLQRETFNSTRRGVSCEALAEWMQSQITDKSAEFPFLRANLAQLHGFAHTLAKDDRRRSAARALRRGDLHARGFFLLWYACCSNRSVKDVQNELSRRRSERRRSLAKMPH